MPKETFVAISGAFASLFVLTTVWTAWQVGTHGADQVSAPIFPAMTLGALVAVLVMKVGTDRERSRAPIMAAAAALSFVVVSLGALAAWFLLAD